MTTITREPRPPTLDEVEVMANNAAYAAYLFDCLEERIEAVRDSLERVDIAFEAGDRMEQGAQLAGARFNMVETLRMMRRAHEEVEMTSRYAAQIQAAYDPENVGRLPPWEHVTEGPQGPLVIPV